MSLLHKWATGPSPGLHRSTSGNPAGGAAACCGRRAPAALAMRATPWPPCTPQEARCMQALHVAHAAPAKSAKGSAGGGGGSGGAANKGQGSKGKDAAVSEKEAHKIFDEVVIVVKSGEGGNGEIVAAGAGKLVKNNKYRPGGNQPKKIWLDASDPADGADGADVYLICDPSTDSLLHLHKRKQYAAAKGSNGNPAVGSGGPKRNEGIRKAVTAPLLIPVPPGTVVKRKGSGALVGELLQPGQRLLVAKGGKGGAGVRAPSAESRQRSLQRELKYARESGAEVVSVIDSNWQEDAKGLPGQQLSLQLLLRVVADVGIVGFPNAGKSSLLAALTRASPAVAPYPFTTLMPNLGVMAAGAGPVLADLPGLIEGAHQGRGLGRMFLRHLRRTQVLLHVVDASAQDPATDYWAVREELRMYNPDYCTRPHVVALNKMDLEDAGSLRSEIASEISTAAARLADQHGPDAMMPPSAIVPVSAATNEGLADLAAALQAALGVPKGARSRRNPWEDGPAAFGGSGGPGEEGFGLSAGFGLPETKAVRSRGDYVAGAWEEEQEQEEEGWEEGEGEVWADEEWDEETKAAAAKWQAALESGTAPAPIGATVPAAGQQQQQQQQEGEGDEEEGVSADEVAGPEDDDLWLLELSEEQLLKMEVE